MRRFWMLTACVVGCAGNAETPVTPPPVVVAVASVTIAESSVPTLVVGSTTQLTATARDAQNAALPGRPIIWSTASEQIATVSATGLVTAIAPGSTQIRATSGGQLAERLVTIRSQPWSLTGALATGRALHTLTLLANGSVLAVGGQVVGPPFSSIRTCELYDPTTGTWRAVGSLATGRSNHIAVRLPSGKVLVTGGYSSETGTRLASAELYDPVTESWSATGGMTEARDIPSAAILADGRVLIVGGSGSGSNLHALSSAELYDPASGTWSPVMPMAVPRSGHTATTLSNGKVVVVGGATGTYAAPTLHATSEVFDPVTGTWTTSGSVTIARGFHRAVALPNARLFITGGSDFVSTVFPSSDLYDASAGGWTAGAALTAARISHSATVLPNGKVLIAGGGPGPLASTEAFEPATGRWESAGSMRVPRSNHAAALLLNGKVLVAGGQGVGAPTTAELHDPG
ncbi:MAG: Ig-like domain-containing protein [Gemmatimonadaceae bacterium]|nr:Ig-like domain-containing protein [Gemmatimonadaceae bacterium]